MPASAAEAQRERVPKVTRSAARICHPYQWLSGSGAGALTPLPGEVAGAVKMSARPVILSDQEHMTCHTLSRRSAAGAGVERGVSVQSSPPRRGRAGPATRLLV